MIEIWFALASSGEAVCPHTGTLRKQSKEFRRRAFDLLIAATALEHNLTLVTRNKDNYEDVPNLRFYQPSS